MHGLSAHSGQRDHGAQPSVRSSTRPSNALTQKRLCIFQLGKACCQKLPCKVAIRAIWHSKPELAKQSESTVPLARTRRALQLIVSLLFVLLGTTSTATAATCAV